MSTATKEKTKSPKLVRIYKGFEIRRDGHDWVVDLEPGTHGYMQFWHKRLKDAKNFIDSKVGANEINSKRKASVYQAIQ